MAVSPERLLVGSELLALQLRRLAYQVLERADAAAEAVPPVLLGLQRGGAPVAERLHELLTEITGQPVRLGLLDATFHRDDFRRRPARPGGGLPPGNTTRLDFALEGQRVVLVDDVLFTGRTVRAALDALLTYGRPASVELLVLVDRRHRRDLPIEASYVGLPVDSLPTERVEVRWEGNAGSVWLLGD